MKKTYILYLGILLSATSCDSFLEEKPRDEVATNQYFSRPEHARDAVNALYRRGAMQMYQTGVYSGARAMFGPYLSGFVDNDYKGQEFHVQRGQTMTFDGLNLSDYFNSMWSDIYAGISRSNNAIKYIPTTPGLPEADAERYMAEAKFFRAMNYYYLVRMFGDVPLITEPYESLENLFLERTPAAQIYELIVDDLNAAIGGSGLANVAMSDNSGRISKTVAQTVLAEVYLTMSGAAIGENNYANSAEVAKAIINSGVHSLEQHTMTAGGELASEGSAYNKLKSSVSIPQEYIYYFEFDETIANNGYPAISYPVTLAPQLAFAITNNAYGPTPPLLNSYDKANDLRVQEKQYFHSSITKDGQVIEFATSPYMWVDEEAANTSALSSKDKVIYSYADVLLIAAEAIAKSEGVTTEAVDYLTQIRARALWKTDASAIRSQLSGLSVDEFVEEVWKERVRELVFEFPIWFDVMRTRKMPAPTDNGSGEINFIDAVGSVNYFNGPIKEANMLFPLPEQELQRNPSLTQNPGYAN
ncbi:hypothetical protein J2X69_004747 [Algoriphagus sp. 4150]|uniref:RagB/SusD family nutrient uptake outer membrane protein n=1 Tax=Algoriphagus sp. 4150 TaxID=2817756 RepID=UPI00285BAB34|nr:RagB/SusD family nutrient uptake outer membrane protein [Algoriphagus sp. 4150]MDR7132380.1 hypothetical protein [Algoriphagus sp. 4150]